MALLVPALAHGDDIDVRMPMRGGFAYDGQHRAANALTGLGAAIDVAKLSRRSRLEVVADIDALVRPELPGTDRLSSKLRITAGIGFVLRTGSYAFVTELGWGPVFDAKEIIGVDLATTIYAYPAYLSVNETTGAPHSVLAILVSGFAVWARGAVDFTPAAPNGGHGGSLAFGVSLDIIRFGLSPLLSVSSLPAAARPPPP